MMPTDFPRAPQNALLKTLEEPNPTSLLILITHDAAALFDTLHSRLQRVPFSLVAAEEMRTLGTLKPENDFLLALGRPGLIKAALMDTEAFGDKKDFLERLSRLGDMTVSERFRLAEDMSKESALVPELLLWLAAMVREKGRITSAPHREATYFFLEALLETESLLRGTQANTRLQLEKLFLKAS
jgi:hypothetical protein